jgi:hypothetical protein
LPSVFFFWFLFFFLAIWHSVFAPPQNAVITKIRYLLSHTTVNVRLVDGTLHVPHLLLGPLLTHRLRHTHIYTRRSVALPLSLSLSLLLFFCGHVGIGGRTL